MREESYNINGITYKRVSKSIARKAWNNNLDVVFVPCYCRLGTWLGFEVETNKKQQEDILFDKFLIAYEYYNCQYWYLGKYAKYFVRYKEGDSILI